MASNDLHAQWIAFCKGATPGARYWLADELFERLSARLSQELRFCDYVQGPTVAITFRGGYEFGGLTFYRKSIFPNPPRRAPRRYPGQQEFYAR